MRNVRQSDGLPENQNSLIHTSGSDFEIVVRAVFFYHPAVVPRVSEFDANEVPSFLF